MKIKYLDKKLGAKKQDVIRLVNRICAEYAAQGYDLTLRQLYYQFVARGYIENSIQSYKWLGDIVNDARLAGLLDWDYIVDRTRNLMGIPTYADPQSFLRSEVDRYYIDKWADQPIRPEVWVEKEALAGVVARAANRQQVDYFPCRGYVSQSEMWSAAQRIGALMRGGQGVHIIHLGDHDPSGIDMSRDIEERLRLFIDKDCATDIVNRVFVPLLNQTPYDNSKDWRRNDPESYDAALNEVRQAQEQLGVFTFERIALNMDQVEELSPPPNPAKVTDSRAKKYIEEYGHESWELDALDPAYINRIITEAILDVQDPDLWDVQVERETEERDLLATLPNRWEEVRDLLRGRS